jgi:DNA-binding CsgD family transcriptional regulator
LYAATAAAGTLADAAAVLRRLARAVGADQYFLLEAPQEHAVERSRIIASDWPRDAIEIIGLDAIARIGTPEPSPGTTSLSLEPRRIRKEELTRRVGFGHARELAGFGFVDVAAGWIAAGLSRGVLMFSARNEEAIDLGLMPEAQMLCSYLWSKLNAEDPHPKAVDPLSERERECLFWVSEGKTTDEVALILDVSANTVNRYILHATQKLSAANRAMAIAVAMRGGLI